MWDQSLEAWFENAVPFLNFDLLMNEMDLKFCLVFENCAGTAVNEEHFTATVKMIIEFGVEECSIFF